MGVQATRARSSSFWSGVQLDGLELSSERSALVISDDILPVVAVSCRLPCSSASTPCEERSKKWARVERRAASEKLDSRGAPGSVGVAKNT